MTEGTAGPWSMSWTVDGEGGNGWSLVDELDSWGFKEVTAGPWSMSWKVAGDGGNGWSLVDELDS